MRKKLPLLALGVLLPCCASLAAWPMHPGEERDLLRVGLQPDGRVVVPTNQILKPAGTQITFPGKPVDLALADGGKTLVVLNLRDLVFIDVATAKIQQTLELIPTEGPEPILLIQELMKAPIGADGKPRKPKHAGGFSVIGLQVDGDRVFASDSLNEVHVARRQAGGEYRWEKSMELVRPLVAGAALPTGIARLSADELWVASSRGNSVQILNRETGQVQQIVPVGVAPFMVRCPRPDRCYVSNWGGDPPKPGAPQALSSGTLVGIDPKTGVASGGTVSILGPVPGRWKQLKTLRVGLQPSGMALSPKGRFLYVANANSDTVSVIDTRAEAVVETIDCRPEARFPFGSGSNALAAAPDGRTLYVANGTNNCVAVVRLGAKATESPGTKPAERSRVRGLIPTAWYPGAVLLSADGKKLFVANVNGVGSLAKLRPEAAGKNTHDFLGSVSIIDVPDAARLAKYTAEVNANNRRSYSLAGLGKPRSDAKPVPVPERHGEPSVFKHVIYVIKENRGYDQILGDVKEGNGDPKLCLFGEEVTPNYHALARQFTLFDNFYCSSALSATGHQFTNEAYVTDYLARAFGGFTRSYPVDGDDALAFASSGFLWDNALARGKTFRNYGEFTTTTYAPANATWADVYNDYKNNTNKVKIAVKPNVASLTPYTHPGYPGFPLVTPDVYRARLFVEDLKKYEQQGTLPNLMYVFLPCDHTTGTRPGSPTPRAMIADNDLALGQVVEAVTRSKFWPETCIFVVEDDPQFSFDHVDGHRSIALAISPYTKRKFVDHTNYTQLGVVKTIELILGLPAINQLDLLATPLRDCFQEKADLTPYRAVPNKVPLDEMNPPLEALRGKALYWARKSLELDLDEADRADEDTLNRILWHSVRGYETPYPDRKAEVSPIRP
jgi:YVTN family beta-propeller protein